jgi:hypothetical protein
VKEEAGLTLRIERMELQDDDFGFDHNTNSLHSDSDRTELKLNLNELRERIANL